MSSKKANSGNPTASALAELNNERKKHEEELKKMRAQFQADIDAENAKIESERQEIEAQKQEVLRKKKDLEAKEAAAAKRAALAEAKEMEYKLLQEKTEKDKMDLKHARKELMEKQRQQKQSELVRKQLEATYDKEGNALDDEPSEVEDYELQADDDSRDVASTSFSAVPSRVVIHTSTGYDTDMQMLYEEVTKWGPEQRESALLEIINIQTFGFSLHPTLK